MSQTKTSNKPDNLKRVRISIPKADTPVLTWLAVQQNISFSVRALIKDAIARQGYVDVTCGEPSAKSPGRPKKRMQEALARAEAGHLYEEDTQENAHDVVYFDLQSQPESSDTVTMNPFAAQQTVAASKKDEPEQHEQPEPQVVSQPSAVQNDSDDDDMALFGFRR